MATEKHYMCTLAANTTKDYIHTLWSFISGGTQTVWRIVSDGGSNNSTDANGDATYDTPTGPSSWSANGYFVMENTTLPTGGSVRVQMKVSYISTTSITAVISFDGGWASKAFPATGSPLATVSLCAAAPAAGDEFYFSASDMPGYSYIQCIRKQPGSPEDLKFVDGYCWRLSGYVPGDAATDLNPYVYFGRKPWCYSGTTTLTWGYATNDANNGNKTPTDTAHTADTCTSANLVNVLSLYRGLCFSSHLTPVGGFFDPTLLIMRNQSTCLGWLDPTYDLRCGQVDRSDGATDTPVTRFMCNDLSVRWYIP